MRAADCGWSIGWLILMGYLMCLTPGHSTCTRTHTQRNPPDLSKPVDVYCEWIDECERINGLAEGVEGDEEEEQDSDEG